VHKLKAEILAELRENERPVLIGLGAIGSWVARWLIANGIAFSGYDKDIVSLKNLAAGAFRESEVGRYKSDVFGHMCRPLNWEPTEIFPSNRTSILVCADHGQTRRWASQRAHEENRRFVCAKANGSLWQVWHVDQGQSPVDFHAFDEAAEANPVLVPCGDSSVGRVASLGAAAELLSIWAGSEITAEEVEAAYGVKFDPAIVHVIQANWQQNSLEAETVAREVSESAFNDEIDRLRKFRDEQAVDQLAHLRRNRRELKKKQRTTIHQRALYLLDNGTDMKNASRVAVGDNKVLATLIVVEAGMRASITASELAIPNTIVLEEVFA